MHSNENCLNSSTWFSRNDSSSVNALLHPEDHLKSPRLRYGEKTQGAVVEKYILSRNNCYCLDDKPPKPTLFRRPNTCISYDDTTRNKGNLKRKSLLCICGKQNTGAGTQNLSASETSKLKEQQPSDSAALQFTRQRENYEDYREKEDDKYKRELDDYRKHEIFFPSLDKNRDDFTDVDTILGTKKYDTETSLTNNDEYFTSQKFTNESFPRYSNPSRTTTKSRPESLKYEGYSVPEFRNEYYFETHKINNIANNRVSQTDHTCVHQFKLNERWLPDPLNKDIFGRSRCKICDRPMEGSSLNLSKSYLFDGKKPSANKIKNFAEAYKSGLAPSTINLGMGKSKMEILLNDNDFERFTRFVSKSQRLAYCNSLALRQQRIRTFRK